MKFSFYKTDKKEFKRTEMTLTLNDVINYISKKEISEDNTKQAILDLSRQEYNIYRVSKSETDKKIYDDTKRKLNAVTFAGTFQPSNRSLLTNTEYSGLICLDIDGIETQEEMDSIFDKIKKDKFTFLCFRSPSNYGYKVLIRTIYPTKNNPIRLDFFYSKTYVMLADYYKTLIGVELCDSGKNMATLCYLTHDDNMYFNDESTHFNSYEKVYKMWEKENSINTPESKKILNSNNRKQTKKEINLARTQGVLKLLLDKCEENNITFNYREWATLSYIIYNELRNETMGYSYFRDFSRIDTLKFDEKKCEAQWASCIRTFNASKAPSYKVLYDMMYRKGVDIDKKIVSELDLKYNDNDLPYLIQENIGNCYIDIHKMVKYIRYPNNIEEGKMTRLDTPTRNRMLIEMKELYLNCKQNMLDIYFETPDNILYMDPLKDKFDSIVTADDSEFKKLYNYFHFQIQPDIDILKIQKWMLGVMGTIFDKGRKYEGMLIFKGRQDCGKTFFIRQQMLKLFYDVNHICEKFNYDKADLPEYQKMMSRNAIILDDESSFSRKEANMIKTILSTDTLQYVEKWEVDITDKKRLASFIGSTNNPTIYDDPTGGKRFHIIDFGDNYLPGSLVNGKLMREEYELDWDKIWGYVYHLFLNEGLRHNDIEYDNTNVDYNNMTPLEKLIKEYFEVYEIKSTDELRNFRDIRSAAVNIATREKYDIRNIDSVRGITCALKSIFGSSLIQHKNKKDGFYNVRVRGDISINQFPTTSSFEFFDLKNN